MCLFVCVCVRGGGVGGPGTAHCYCGIQEVCVAGASGCACPHLQLPPPLSSPRLMMDPTCPPSWFGGGMLWEVRRERGGVGGEYVK